MTPITRLLSTLSDVYVGDSCGCPWVPWQGSL